MREHRLILRAVRLLERALERINRGEVPSFLPELLEFFGEYADLCHHAKEEAVLFSAASEAMGCEGGPLGMLVCEHMRLRRLRQEMKKRLGTPEFRRPAEEFCALLREHIQKEDEGVFPMTEAHLPPEEDDRLLQGYEEYMQRLRVAMDWEERLRDWEALAAKQEEEDG